jgi:hypothetical protein
MHSRGAACHADRDVADPNVACSMLQKRSLIGRLRDGRHGIIYSMTSGTAIQVVGIGVT